MLKKYNKYIERINELRKKEMPTENYFALKDEIHDRYIGAKTKQERDEIHAEFIRRDKEYCDAKTANKRLMLIIKVHQNNAKKILADEITPIICDVLNEYANKQYGDKTKQAIKDRLKALTNCSVYLYSNHCVVNVLDNNGFNNGVQITIYTKEKNILNDNNRIQALNIDDFKLNFTYINNPVDYIDGVLKKYQKLYSAYEKYRNALDDINALTGSVNLKYINPNETIYKSYLDFYY